VRLSPISTQQVSPRSNFDNACPKAVNFWPKVECFSKVFDSFVPELDGTWLHNLPLLSRTSRSSPFAHLSVSCLMHQSRRSRSSVSSSSSFSSSFFFYCLLLLLLLLLLLHVDPPLPHLLYVCLVHNSYAYIYLVHTSVGDSLPRHGTVFFLLLSSLELSDTEVHEPSSEPLHIYKKYLF